MNPRPPLQVLRTAEASAANNGKMAQRAAREAGEEAMLHWLFAAALRIRSILPTAHTLVVDTTAWLEQRGENRPDITRVLDRHGTVLFDHLTESIEVVDQVLEACTMLDHGLRHIDPWQVETNWDPLETEYGPSYSVTLPAFTADLDTACRQLAHHD